ncbi:MAG: HEPN domain-containing protein [Bacteroidota bacterium]
MSPKLQRVDVVRYWWAKAEQSLASARRELDAGALDFAMNRIYYAAFYAASAALLDRQTTFKKHSGVRAAFHQRFIKSGLLDVQWGKFYDRLFEDRQEGDYAALVAFERDYVQSQLAQCHDFHNQLRPLVSSLPAI